MAAVLKHWREASTLILVSARQKSPDIKPNFVNSTGHRHAGALKGTNLEVLLLKRSAGSKFMPNLYVFPGGVASDVDFSPAWIPLFDSFGKDHRQNVFNFVQRGGRGASMFSRLRDEQFSHIPSEIAFRICAIRETFEESGVLIARRTENGKEPRPAPWDGGTWASYIEDEESTDDIKEWRHRVNKDPQEFLRMCQELSMVPDVWSLYEWSNWLTPRDAKHRFDTAFYICCVQGKPHAAEDEGETVHSQWGSPYDILYEYYHRRVALPPPQLYELGRLVQFGTAQEVLKFSWQREQQRVKRFLPVRVATSDSYLSIIPGDGLYPTDIDPEGPPFTITYDKTLAELDKSHPQKHRFVLMKDKEKVDGKLLLHVACNIDTSGHVSPDFSGSQLLQESFGLNPKL